MTDAQGLLERTGELAAKLVDGELAAEEAEELTQLLQGGEERLGVLADHLLLDSLLSDELGKGSLTALVDLVADPPLDTLASDSDPSRFATLAGYAGSYWKPAGWAVAAALAGLMALMVFRGDATAFANAATVVQAAMESHAEAVERVYVVQVESRAAVDAEFTLPRDVRVATQGDRFYVEMNGGERRWFWGRDASGATWMTLGPRRALRIAPDETGPALAYISDLYSLHLESVLANSLRHCEIETTGETGPAYVVKAIPKRPAGWLRAMVIDVDKETKAVRKLVLHRRTPNQGDATVTFTLVDARTPDETKYQAEGHLTEPFQIFSREFHAERRRDVLTSWFGVAADRWVVSIPKADERQDLSTELESALRKRVEALFEALRSGDANECLRLTDPAILEEKGRDNVKRFFQSVSRAVKATKVQPSDRIVQGIVLINDGQRARVDIQVTIDGVKWPPGFEVWALIDGQWFYRETPK